MSTAKEAPTELSIEFDQTIEDFLTLLRDTYLNEPTRLAAAMRQQRSARRSVVVVFLLAAMLVYPALILGPQQDVARNLVVCVIVGLVFSASQLWRSAKAPRSVIDEIMNDFRTQIAKGELRPILGRRSITISRAAVVIESTVVRHVLQWHGVTRVVEIPTHILMFSSYHDGWAIPKAAFSTPDDASRFLAFANELHESSDGSLRARLADSDEFCFSCGYNLRGSDGQVCPECGVRLLLAQHTVGPPAPVGRREETARKPL